MTDQEARAGGREGAHGRGREGDLARLALLAEPVRRRVYEVVAGSESADRDTVAEAVGIGRSLAAFHLDRLVAGGLLEASFRRRGTRSGPGAGRPAKFYALPANAAVSVSLPPRRYDVAATLFAEGLEQTKGGREAVLQAARAAGLEAATAASAHTTDRARRELLTILDDRGFEPRPRADGGIDLGNCPFRDLTADHRELTCGANLALLSAIADSTPGAGLVAERQDPPEPCCVTLRPVAYAPDDRRSEADRHEG
jgi:predicted ArsR family transcriptional regulator